jgi:flagellar hook assembly protein FlgD
VNEDHTAEVLRVFTLSQNAPNPFNPATVISFVLARPEVVRLAVYDALGREVAVLAEGNFSAGSHEVRWDGRDRTGAPVSSGVYLYRFDAGGKTDARKMLLVR